MTVPVAMIAAVGRNGVIGAGSTIPWRLPSDFAHFKHMTLGKPLIMGRKTFESIGRPLPGRTNIVISRQAGYQPDGVVVVDSVAAALHRAQDVALAGGASEVMVGGGGEIYREMMPLADRLYISHVDLEPAGEALFPTINPEQWMVIEEPPIEPHPQDSATYRVKVYERRWPRVR